MRDPHSRHTLFSAEVKIEQVDLHVVAEVKGWWDGIAFVTLVMGFWETGLWRCVVGGLRCRDRLLWCGGGFWGWWRGRLGACGFGLYCKGWCVFCKEVREDFLDDIKE